jgi:hypothetical protein
MEILAYDLYLPTPRLRQAGDLTEEKIGIVDPASAVVRHGELWRTSRTRLRRARGWEHADGLENWTVSVSFLLG